jgi:hypothetical protein
VDIPANAARIRYHLPPTLASKTVSLLTSLELQRLRDSLATKIKPASVDRLFEGSRRRSILRPRTTQAWGKWRVRSRPCLRETAPVADCLAEPIEDAAHKGFSSGVYRSPSSRRQPDCVCPIDSARHFTLACSDGSS